MLAFKWLNLTTSYWLQQMPTQASLSHRWGSTGHFTGAGVGWGARGQGQEMLPGHRCLGTRVWQHQEPRQCSSSLGPPGAHSTSCPPLASFFIWLLLSALHFPAPKFTCKHVQIAYIHERLGRFWSGGYPDPVNSPHGEGVWGNICNLQGWQEDRSQHLEAISRFWK